MKKSTVTKIATITALITTVIIACTKSDTDNAAVITDAIIYNSGAVAADGCDWTIRIPATDSTYSPVNLADQYKVNALKVHIRYHPLSTKFSCGWGAKLRQISIDNITKITQ